MSTSSQEPELYVKLFHDDNIVKNGVIKIYIDETLKREYNKDWINSSYK